LLRTTDLAENSALTFMLVPINRRNLVLTMLLPHSSLP
jgi:hypothetical protein